jgi:hypothetical protein
MPVKPAPVPIAPLTSDYRRLSSSNSSRKRSHAESVGTVDRKGYVRPLPTSVLDLDVLSGIVARGGASIVTPPNDPSHKGHPGVQELKPIPSQSQVPAPAPRPPPTYHYIGSTTQFEALLFRESFLEQDDEVCVTSIKVQRVDGNDTYTRVTTAMDHVSSNPFILAADSEQYFRLDRETLGLYFSHVNSVLPLLNEAETWHLFNTGMLDPTLLISINLISQRWKESKIEGPIKPAINTMEEVAVRQFNSSLAQPLLSTVQAGLLLIQSSTRTPYLMSTQLTTIGYELGLHQDCSQWKISEPERNLRKRLGWMLYAQDKWFSLLHGRPSYVSPANWTIPPLSEQAFEDGAEVSVQFPTNNAAPASSAVFMIQFTTLTQILSEILETFHTLGAEADVKAAGCQGLRVVLERAKPVQIKLKNWFSRLPDSLKMDASGNDTLFAHGSLHLAYFATEITLHRCIIRATAQPDTDSYLSYICRSAAKTRLISAMDFVNRLRPVHLQSFWPFAGFSHFALVGTFGALLEATAPTKEEAEFYRMRLEEYRWTLMVSRGHAEFLGYAIDSLDTNLVLLRNLPEKPRSTELGPSHATQDADIPESSMLDLSQGQDSAHIQRGPAMRSFSGLVSPATSSTSSSSSSIGQGPYLESNQSR